jgi:hypothetical protein
VFLNDTAAGDDSFLQPREKNLSAALDRNALRRTLAFLTSGCLILGSISVSTRDTVCKLVTDPSLIAAVSIPKPAYLQSVTDPRFGAKIFRITGDPGAAIPGVGGTWGNITRHNYSKDAVWNADQSLIVLKRVQGATGHLFLDGTTYNPQFRRAGPGGETRWHPTQSDMMIYLTAGCQLGYWNVLTDVRTVVITPLGYTSCSLGPWEGNTSHDGQWAAVHATRSSDGKQVGFAVNLGSPQKYPDIDLRGQGITAVDWLSISAAGAYLVVNGTISGCTTVGGNCDATKVFTRDGASVGPFWSEYGVPSHYDLTLDGTGNEVAVGVAKSSTHEGKVVMRRLRDGVVTPLTVGGYASHTSARNLNRSGWAFVTHSYNGPYWPPFRNELFAVKLDGSLAIERIAGLQATTPTYDAQPQAVPSPDGRRVIFASDWNSSSGLPIQAYVADIRPLCLAAPSQPQNVRIVPSY